MAHVLADGWTTALEHLSTRARVGTRYDHAVTSMAVTVFAFCMLLLVLLPAAFFFTNYPCHRRKYDSKEQSEVRGTARCVCSHACSLQYGPECVLVTVALCSPCGSILGARHVGSPSRHPKPHWL